MSFAFALLNKKIFIMFQCFFRKINLLKMKFTYLLVAMLANICLSEAFLWGDSDKWDDLKVTWGINPFGSNNFVSLPRTISQALSKGIKKLKNKS